MKKFSLNLKYITFALALIIGSFASASSSSADTTIPYNCSGGGNAYAIVDMTPRGPFPANATPAETFVASGQIVSTCSTRMVNLTVQNNNDPVVIIIDDTLMNPGVLPLSPITQYFNVPGPSSPSYNLHFVLGVDDTGTPPPPSCYAYVRFVGTFRYGGVLWLGAAIHPEVNVTVALAGNSSNGTTTNEPLDYEVFTIPENATQSTMGEFYAATGFDHGWVTSTDIPWVCGDETQNYVVGTQQCDYTTSCGQNRTCADESGYRITSPSLAGTCPTACRYPNGPDKQFSTDATYNSKYCPIP